MTTDPFTTAARAEARRLWPGTDAGHLPARFAFLDGAEWARAHLAAQKPTDAEVRAVMQVARTHYSTPVEIGPSFARAVLSAARAARRDEEKR